MTEKRASLRTKIGVWMFFLPVVSFVITPLLVPLLGLSAGTGAALIGIVVAVGEVIWFLSIPLLGKEGFHQLKSKTFGFIKLPTGPVSQGRHKVGVTMFLGSFVAEMLVVALLIYSYFHYSAGEYPSESIHGLTFEAQALTFVSVQIGAAICAVASLFVLGSGFFRRLQSVFEWSAEA